MFFIVSTGRSGTMTIADWLSRSLDCVCLHEPEPRLIAETAQYLYGIRDHGDMVDLLRRTRPTLPLKQEQQYGESHHVLSYVIPALREAFPEAKFVWLIRDGRKVVASMFARDWYSGKWFHRSPSVRQWEEWRIRGDYSGAMSRRDWLSLSRFEKCCWHWTYKNRLIEHQLAVTGATALTIHLENLGDRADELFDFLGLRKPDDATLSHLNEARSELGQAPTPWQIWRPEQTMAFDAFCGIAMDDWYPEWRAETDEVWQAPGLIVERRVQARRKIKRYVNKEMGIYQLVLRTYKIVRHRLLGPMRRALLSSLANVRSGISHDAG